MNKLITFVFCLLLLNANSQTQTVTFNPSTATQTWVVPPCVTSISMTIAGGEGGGTNGGNGAVLTGTYAVTPGQTISMVVGGAGGLNSAGINGGGAGRPSSIGAAWASGGGGGGTKVSFGGPFTIFAGGGGGGLHRRDGLPPGRGAHRGGHLRHRLR